MTEYKISKTVQQINLEVLNADLQSASEYISYVKRGDELHVILSNDSQFVLDAIDAIVLAHDPEVLTPEQQAEQARQTLVEGATFSKQSLPLIKAFNDDPEADVKAFLASGGSSTTLDRNDPLNQTYTHWRPIFESLSDDVKVRIMWHGYMHSATFEFYPEPETPSAEYKAWFNNACSQVIGYMTNRAQM